MRSIAELRASLLARVAVIALVPIGLGACASDMSRFSGDPMSSPYAGKSGGGSQEMTGSLNGGGGHPVRKVESRPLGDPMQQTSQVHSGQINGGNLPPPPDRFKRQPIDQAGNAGAAGGGSGGGHSFQPAREVAGSAGARAGQPALKSPPAIHVVATGENLISIARLYGKSRNELAQANGLDRDGKVRIGQRLTIPGVGAGQVKSAQKGQEPQIPQQPAKVAKQALAPKQGQAPVGGNADQGQAQKQQQQAQNQQPSKAGNPQKAAEGPVKTEKNQVVAQKLGPVEGEAQVRVASQKVESEDKEEQGRAGPGFRWPVRGRVITGYGPKPNGQHNDGINLAVPEGTSIKAAEDGVVTYAGNELKGYGNLVLVRHPNGYVTAYAHASELTVKRGDQVRRGQIIAKAGQTGNVQTPQLHFEIRKGSAPVDPLQHLTGG